MNDIRTQENEWKKCGAEIDVITIQNTIIKSPDENLIRMKNERDL